MTLIEKILQSYPEYNWISYEDKLDLYENGTGNLMIYVSFDKIHYWKDERNIHKVIEFQDLKRVLKVRFKLKTFI